MLTPLTISFLGAASFAAGIINTIAGGGSFLTFPALLMSGLDPQAANITSTLALFPMQVSTGLSGRSIAGDAPQLTFKELIVVSFLGGVLGAALLLLTPPVFFARLVPWLILFATLVFAYGSFIKKPGDLGGIASLNRCQAALVQFGISVYGGYFGGGAGFLMLAALTLAGMPIRQAGATKNILAAVMNAAAIIIFVFSPHIGWAQAGIVSIASVAGGRVGLRLLTRINEHWLRLAVVVLGIALTIAMFLY